MGLSPAPFVVLKFGGTSVSTRQRWQTIADIARRRIDEGFRPFVVCSALAGVSNQLEALARSAPQNKHGDLLNQVVERHHQFAASMGVRTPTQAIDVLDDVGRIALGASLLGEGGPRVEARIMAAGELLSTLIGAEWMRQELGLNVHWIDARDWLLADPDESASVPDLTRHYLGATCSRKPQPELTAALNNTASDTLDSISLTQGFIARDAAGATVLLGRGGSDTSAAYFAARLQAARCEIWTDVPGMFTADPRIVPDARHIRRVDFDEAQEIATTGAKVLHPRCIAPCRDAAIPMHVRSALHPDLEGTVISNAGGETVAGIKAISVKRNVTLVTMDTVGMWQQVGFLADAFACFQRAGLSIDLVSTSETSVTVTLDPSANSLHDAALDDLITALAPICNARVIRACTAISLVGSRIRSIFARLAPAFALFDEQRVYLVTQAASDLNLSFVVDDAEAPKLVKRLHDLLFRDIREGALFGATWNQLLGAPESPVQHGGRWWSHRRDELLQIDVSKRPVYVYDAAGIRSQARALRELRAVERVFYAVKANPHAGVLALLAAEGLGFECVSPGEIDAVRDAIPGIDPGRILFTPNFAAIEEYRSAFDLGVIVNLDNLHPLRHHPDVFAGRQIFVRVDPGQGRGHHAHVRTGGRGSKFGIDRMELPELRALAEQHGVTVVGIHAHAGSGILTADHWRETALTLVEFAQHFASVRFIDVGGGLGVVERPDQQPLDLSAMDEGLAAVRTAHPQYVFWLEPGRFLVARAGVLLARVNQTKSKGDWHYVGINAGMNALIRPALYGAQHDIVNLTRLHEAGVMTASVVGPICESGDTLGVDRRLPVCHEGDVMLIDTVGAYGFAMASRYNLRELPEQVLLAESRA
jgi:bifunctional diaminopimelate decarboxylase / aspartate kinase